MWGYHIYVYIHVYIYIYVCVYIYIYIHTRMQMGSAAPDNSWEYDQRAINAQVLQTERILTCFPETSNMCGSQP